MCRDAGPHSGGRAHWDQMKVIVKQWLSQSYWSSHGCNGGSNQARLQDYLTTANIQPGHCDSMDQQANCMDSRLYVSLMTISAPSRLCGHIIHTLSYTSTVYSF